jgi:hypothetical protein
MQKPVRKRRWLRRILRTVLVLLILFLGACFVFDHYYQFRKNDEELEQFIQPIVSLQLSVITKQEAASFAM